MRRIFTVTILVITAISLDSCKKEKQAEYAPLAETDWRINIYYYHSDPSWADAPFPVWKLKFMNDKSFMLDLGDNLCTGTYAWHYTPVNNIIQLQFQIDTWNNPSGMDTEGNKIKEMMESAYKCNFYPNHHITINSLKGTIDAQTY